MFTEVKIQTFELKDLVNRTLKILSLSSNHLELIAAKDLKTGEIFIIEEIRYPITNESYNGKFEGEKS